MTDLELAEACKQGKRDAQQKVFEQYVRVMMTVCLRYANSRQEAEDILQEGFIKVFERIKQYEGRGPLGGWIRSVMVNTALNLIRKNKRHHLSLDEEAADRVDAEDTGPIEQMSADELMKLISQMPAGYKTVFNLFAIEGYAHKEIAEMLEITESTSKTQFFKAKNWLTKAITLAERTT